MAALLEEPKEYQEMLLKQVIAGSGSGSGSSSRGPDTTAAPSGGGGGINGSAAMSRSTRLLEKRNETLQVQAQLEAHKEQFSRHEQAMVKREEELRKKDHELQESLQKFNKFLTDNDAKRSEAEKKLVENKKFLDQKDEEIAQLRRLLEQLRAEEVEKRRLLDKHAKYQKFFQSVLERSEDYKEVHGLIERWLTLNKTQHALQSEAEMAGRRSEELKAALQKYLEDKANEVLAINNSIAELQQQLETQLERSLQEEAVREERAEQLVGKTLEYTQIRMAVENIYRRVCERCGQKFKKTSIFRQLDFLGAVMVDYQDIYNKGKKRLAESAQAGRGSIIPLAPSASGVGA